MYRLIFDSAQYLCQFTIAYLGPEGTYTQLAALTYSLQLEQTTHQTIELKAFPSIPRAMQATAQGEATVAIVPVENSTEGGVTTTLDTLWRLSPTQNSAGLSHAYTTWVAV